MRQYRLALVLKSGMTKEQKDALLKEVKGYAGNVDKEKVEELGEKKFAYPLKKERKGEYVSVEFTSDKVMDEFERRLILKEEILRHLLVRED
jgi:ribosomal protein S6